MKIISSVSVAALLGWILPVSCFATAVGTSIVEQPVNLGAKSDPGRIPLGGVGVVSNHGYGIHAVIGEARACPRGAMRWEGGSELDQNLASVFGISIEAQDSTQILAFPVTLRVKPWKPPGYSPYSKEQVLAATLWCLIRSTYSTPETPLDVRVVAEGADDKALEEKFSGKYVSHPGKDGAKVPPVQVRGTALEVDARGIAWVVFPDVARKAAFVPPTPGMIIMEAGGDGDPGWRVLPVWGNGTAPEEFLRINSESAIMAYSSYHSRGVQEANSFLSDGGANGFTAVRGDKSDSVSLSYPRVNQATLAADILALVISAQPTEARPLSVSFLVEESSLASYPAFRGAPGWKESIDPNNHVVLECEFVWDAVSGKLTKGFVPLVRLEDRAWITLASEPASADEEAAEKLAVMVQYRIMGGIHDGSLLAEKIMPVDQLRASGLLREIGKAGYYEALATYSNGKTLPDNPQDDPVRLGSSEAFQAHHAGWTIGLSQGEAIAIAARKTIAEAKLKKDE